ncbi:MAG TPA: NmrA/HSCARG family protein [Sphingomicrobium sp.]|nr:NmrA/HSCARG family protein [Sphingomicrobium sp.]
MIANDRKTIAVVGATGLQGGGVVRALQADGRFKVRALTRDPAKHRDLAEEAVAADLDRPESLNAAFEGAYGVFLVTNFWEQGTDELKQVAAAVRAAKDAGVQHFIWSTLPNVEAISGGTLDVPHFTNKAKADRIISEAGFAHHTFVVAPMYYQNLTGLMAPQKQADGSTGWALPIDPKMRGIHMGDIGELGAIVAGAFTHPDLAGHGEYLPLVGDFLSFNDIVDTLNRQGHAFTVRQVPGESFAASFPGAAEVAATFAHFEANTYLGSDMSDEIALANKVAGRNPTSFADWARTNFALVAA